MKVTQPNRELTKIEKLHVEYIMSNFNFLRVMETMNKLEWTWATGIAGEEKIPSYEEIKEVARDILCTAITSTTGYLSTGGFVANYDEKEEYLSLKFVVEECDTRCI